MDTELENFKQINLVEYAGAHGYEIDRGESSRASVVMRRGVEKIIVATDVDGHGVFFSVRDDSDNGSIIDFVQHRQGFNLGQVRKELRQWIAPSPSSYRPCVVLERTRKPEPSTLDRQQVLASWMRMRPIYGQHTYLERDRKLSARILSDPRFSGMVRIDARGNGVFPHYDRDGLAGFELKNVGFTGFSRGGVKALWHSSNLARARLVVVVESAIDALSHAQLVGNPGAAYFSTGGSMSEYQRDLVGSAMSKAHARGATIIVATDSDEPGRKQAADLLALAPASAKLSRHEPVDGKDWNEILQIQAAGVEA